MGEGVKEEQPITLHIWGPLIPIDPGIKLVYILPINHIYYIIKHNISKFEGGQSQQELSMVKNRW